MNSLLPRKHRRHVIDLQLTAMIDIFSMLIIFLIRATVFGVSDISIDPSVRLPQSISKENLDSAPTAQVLKDKVLLSISPEPIPLEAFSNANDPRLSKLRELVQAHVKKLKGEGRSSGILLNVAADRDLPYSSLFQAIKVLRESGFESLLFLSTASESAPKEKAK